MHKENWKIVLESKLRRLECLSRKGFFLKTGVDCDEEKKLIKEIKEIEKERSR